MSVFRKPQVIQRQGQGSYVNGEWIPGAITPLNILATVQPAKMEDMITLPVGRRLADFIKLYTSTELLTVGEGVTAQQPDLFDWHGHTYQCDSVAMWQNGIRSHWKAIFVKVSQA